MTTTESQTTEPQSREPLSLTKRLLIAAGLFVLLAAGGFIFFFGGIMIAVMATDGCPGLPDWASLYLGAWPIIMGLTVLIPPILVVVKVHWLRIALVAFAGIVISFGWLIAWFPIVLATC